MISSKAYLDSVEVSANFAVISALDSSVVKDETTVDNYFKSLPHGSANARLAANRFAYFFPPGNYIIVIQLENSLFPGGKKTYTYKRVSTTDGTPSANNNMLFSSAKTEYYQEWVNK